MHMLWNAVNGCVNVKNSDMYYVSFGSGEKNLILLPGLSDGLATVKGKALLLAEPYRLFFKDYTVYMFSRRNDLPKDYTIEDMADDQAEALRNLNINTCDVLGVSQGGMIAMALAVRYPKLVSHLVLAVTAPSANETVRTCVNRWLTMTAKNYHRALMIDTAENTYSEKKLKTYRKTYPLLGKVGKPENYGRFEANAQAILKFDMTERLPEISCPVLIIGGSEDRIVGAKASFEMHKLIPQSQIFMYEGLGHGAYEEAKDFNQRIYDFLKEG